MHTGSSEESAIYVHGVGWIGQYDSWVDVQREKGIYPYFVRDMKCATLERLLDAGAADREEVEMLARDINRLNSEIRSIDAATDYGQTRHQAGDSRADSRAAEGGASEGGRAGFSGGSCPSSRAALANSAPEDGGITAPRPKS